MKKILAIILTAAMAFAVTACKNGDVTSSDMSKVDGKELDTVKTDGVNDTDSTEIGSFEIEIEDAKVIDTEDGKAVVVEFYFKNNTPSEKTFDGIFKVDAEQGGSTLNGATVVDVEGVDILSATTAVPAGGDAEVQRVYELNDEENEVTVRAYVYGEPEGGMVTKTFKLK